MIVGRSTGRRGTLTEVLWSARPEWLACCALTVLWLIPLAIIGIHGDFPLNDDWAYAWTTERLLETGEFERHGWTWTTVISNILIGYLFSKIFGFSYETLRASGVFMGWLGLIGCYVLCRQMGVARRWSVLVALVTAFNPIYLNLSYTYMTDVPFTAFVVWSLIFLVHGLKCSSWGATVTGILLTIVAILSRQPGLSLLVAVALTILVRERRNPRALVLCTIGIAVVTGGVLFGLSFINQEASGHHFYSIKVFLERAITPDSPYFLANNSITSLVYLGLFTAPIWVLLLRVRKGHGRLALVSAGLSLLVLPVLISRDLRMPLAINIIYDLGVGPVTLSGKETLPGAAVWIWQTVLVVGLVGGWCVLGLLLLELWQKRSCILDHAPWLLLFFFAATYLGALVFRWPFFDRYYLPILAPLAVLLLAPMEPMPGRLAVALSVGMLVVLAAFGVLGTRDYLEHHRHRWSLLEELLAQQIPSQHINGGLEFGGMFNYGPRGRSSWWVRDEQYIVTYRENIPGYTVVASREYRRLLPPRLEKISVHQRSE